MAWDEWSRGAGNRLDHALSEGRASLMGSHDQQCEGLKSLARLAYPAKSKSRPAASPRLA
jgi:hypothetical protein